MTRAGTTRPGTTRPGAGGTPPGWARLGLGAGAELRQPLGVAIVGGLLVSQVITLFITPVIYLFLDRYSGKGPLTVSLETAPTPQHG